MKKTIMIACLLGLLNTNYAQKIYDHGILYTTVEARKGSPVAGNLLSTVESKTFLANGLLKIISTSTVETQVFINRAENKAVTFIELMGKKLGFTAPTNSNAIDTFDVITVDSSKIINGFNCRLAKIIYKRTGEKRNPAMVWYSSDFKFTDTTMGFSLSGIEKLPGVPIQIMSMLPQSIFVSMTVNRIDLDTVITPSEFIVPKDVILYKTPQEFQSNIVRMQREGN